MSHLISLADRMRAAADTLDEVSALYGYPRHQHAPWSADELRTEAVHVAADYPDSSALEPLPVQGINSGSADGTRPAPSIPRPGAGRGSPKSHN